MPTNKQELIQFIKYVIGGGITTLIELVILYLLTNKVGMWYVYSSIIVYGFGFTISFFIRKIWAYKDYDFSKTGQQFLVYILILSVTLVLNTLILTTMVRRFHFHYLLAQFLGGIVIGWLGFLINDKITFNKMTND